METLAVIRHNSYVSGSLLSSEVQMRKSHLIQGKMTIGYKTIKCLIKSDYERGMSERSVS